MVSRDEILDVAVVGGGVAGVYSAWRLMCDRSGRRGPPPKVAVLEGSDRIGGGILSLTPPGMEPLRVELGAMFFMNVQPIVASLVERLGLRVQSVPRVK